MKNSIKKEKGKSIIAERKYMLGERPGRTKGPILNFDFNRPDHARRFLKGFRMPNGAKIEFVQTKKGDRVSLIDATDDQITQYASQIYSDLYEPQGSPYYFEEELVN